MGIEELCEDNDIDRVGDTIHIKLEKVDAPVEYTVTTTTTLNTSSLTPGDESILVENMNSHYSTLLAGFPVESVDTTTETGSVKLVTKIVFKSDTTTEKLAAAKAVIGQVNKQSMIDEVLTPSIPASVVSELQETLEDPDVGDREGQISSSHRSWGHVYQLCDWSGQGDINYRYFIYADGFGTAGLLDKDGKPIGVRSDHKFLSCSLHDELETRLCFNYTGTSLNYLYQTDDHVTRTFYMHHEDLISDGCFFEESPCCEVVDTSHENRDKVASESSLGEETKLTATIILDVSLSSITSDEQSALVNTTRTYFLSSLGSSLDNIKEITTTIEEGSVKIITTIVFKSDTTLAEMNVISSIASGRLTKESVVSYVLTPSLEPDRLATLKAVLLESVISPVEPMYGVSVLSTPTSFESLMVSETYTVKYSIQGNDDFPDDDPDSKFKYRWVQYYNTRRAQPSSKQWKVLLKINFLIF